MENNEQPTLTQQTQNGIPPGAQCHLHPAQNELVFFIPSSGMFSRRALC